MQGFNLVELINTSHFKASLTRGVWRPKPGKDEKLPLGIRRIYDRALQVLKRPKCKKPEASI
jgi:retron-type reverse transcriptase